MLTSHYYVIFDEGGWKIQCDDENPAPYPHKRDAFREAVALAHLDDKKGREAHVIVQCENQIFRPQWDFSTDQYLPPLMPDC